MIDREYIAADGTIKVKKSLTYDPWIKSKLVGVLAPSIIMLDRKGVYRKIYDEYKNRLNNEPWRAEALIECTSKGNVVYEENGRPKMRPAFPKIRIENMSRRYMIKMFLIDLYVHWCVLEGIPVKTRTDMHMRLLFQQKMQRAHGAAVYTEPGAATAG